ncbi:MAG: hypothetical protein HY561_12165 [Gemmatimonadetes bacterium]|nr:hypothetical protein [Gemmatimonadota bacterium]MBI4543173.1 hypothetical protein [Gemmatimonadota bacterium]
MPRPVAAVESRGKIIVVCDDGTVYRADYAFTGEAGEMRWEMLPPVPNSEAHDRLQSRERQGSLRWMAA